MPLTLDEQMETASQALAELDYARCEALCVDALKQARDQSDWVMVQRVLLPLQEARRQRRQAALDGLILLGTPEKTEPLEALLADPKLGCIMLTQPYTPEDALALDRLIRQQKRAIELIYAGHKTDDPSNQRLWGTATYKGPWVGINQTIPDVSWFGKTLSASGMKPPTPAHWFMYVSETLGDALIREAASMTLENNKVPEKDQQRAYFDMLLEALNAVDNHEKLHQALARAAKALHEAKR